MLRYFQPGQSPSAVMSSPAAKAWRTRRKPKSFVPTIINDLKTGRQYPGRIFQNTQGQRIDVPLGPNIDTSLINELRHRKHHLCNSHYLKWRCNVDSCLHDHTSKITDRELEALKFLCRSIRCSQGSTCVDVQCIKGHMCPSGRKCTRGNACRFADLHGMDITISKHN